MGYVYMINGCCVNLQKMGTVALPEVGEKEVEAIVLTNIEGKSIFHHMRRIYQFLDDWKALRSDCPLLLVVDSETAKIVNSYFFDVSGKEYECFTIEDGTVYRYLY